MVGLRKRPAAGHRNPLLPIALLLLIGVLWGTFYVLIKIGVTGGVSPSNYLFWFTLGAGACLYGVGVLRGRRPKFARAHFVLAAINFYAIFELIRIAGATYMSQANFLSAGVGVVFGLLIFDERHGPFVWAAIGLILAGVALVGARRA